MLAASGAFAAKRVLLDGETMSGGVPRQLTARARATALGQQLGRAIGVRDASDIDFERWHDYVPLGDDAFEYYPARDVLSVRTFNVDTHFEDPTPTEIVKGHQADRGMNASTVGGMFERGGSYYLVDSQRETGFMVVDYPVAALSGAQLRAGYEYHANLAATWRLHWGTQVSRIVHGRRGATSPMSSVIWDDDRHALAADVSRLRGRDRADALVRAYLAHRLVKGAALDRDGRYDAGDFYLRYDPAGEALEAGVFVATPADLARLAAAGLTPERVQSSIDSMVRRGTFAGPPATAPGAVPAAGHPFPAPAEPAAFLRVLPLPGAVGGPTERMAYLVQRWPAATLTPTALHLAMEQLFDYGTVWRHRWLWRAARIALGRERAPAGTIERTPDDYGFDPAAERLDAAPVLHTEPRPGAGGGAP